MESGLSPFTEVLLFILAATLFIAGGLITSRMIRPDRPGEQKLLPYESGEQPLGNAWGQINIRFYLLGLIFLLFEVEIIFLFPWAIVFGDQKLIEQSNGTWGWLTLAEMFIFLGILFLGLLFAWKMGYLDWPLPGKKKSGFSSPVPRSMYERINKKYDS
jgi:NADH-quinone oxidoreductase subunit A